MDPAPKSRLKELPNLVRANSSASDSVPCRGTENDDEYVATLEEFLSISSVNNSNQDSARVVSPSGSSTERFWTIYPR